MHLIIFTHKTSKVIVSDYFLRFMCARLQHFQWPIFIVWSFFSFRFPMHRLHVSNECCTVFQFLLYTISCFVVSVLIKMQIKSKQIRGIKEHVKAAVCLTIYRFVPIPSKKNHSSVVRCAFIQTQLWFKSLSFFDFYWVHRTCAHFFSLSPLLVGMRGAWFTTTSITSLLGYMFVYV